MAKSFETQGIIHSIGATTEFGSNGFTKREFVIKLSGEGENDMYPNFVGLELTKDKCSLLDTYKVGSEIKVHFNLTGRLWSPPDKPEKCFVNLQAWKIDGIATSSKTETVIPEKWGEKAGSTPIFEPDGIPF